MKLKSTTICALLLSTIVLVAVAQPPPMRRHTANQKRQLRLVPADQQPSAESLVETSAADGHRVIRVNGVPEHTVGRFPNRGNPHVIEVRESTFRVTLSPAQNAAPLSIPTGTNFGVAVNGVLFDPGAAEYWQGDQRSGWRYEALAGAVPLGLDANHAHVQPNGKYHYHGIPTGLLANVEFDRSAHSPLVGWAADGFPIYAINGFTDPEDASSKIKQLQPSYRLKQGNRPGGPRGDRSNPGGTYDGTFVQDYEYVEGLGDLDQCNGRYCVTPEYPEGTYAYFLTDHWPSIPRMFRGTPHQSFQRRGPPPGGGRGFRPPPRRFRRPQGQ